MSAAAAQRQTPAWRVITPLLPHQQEAVAKLLPSRVGALFGEMGTGKTLVGIMLIWLRREKIDRVLWFGPVSSKETIRRQILLHTDCDPADILVFDDRTDETTPPRAWNLVGTESVGGSARVYCAAAALVTARTMVVVDESHTIKGHRAVRSLRLTNLAAPARYRLILTGTPISQGLQDLFAQMRFLSADILGYRSFWTFANNHLAYSERYKGLITGTRNADYLAAKIKPYVYQITKEECLNLPAKLGASRWCDLTDEQLAAYADAKDRVLCEDYLMGDDWARRVALYRLFSLLQGICCGFCRGEDGAIVDLPHRRLETLFAAIAGLPDEPVVIWAKYHYAIDQIREALVSRYGGAAVQCFHGRLSERDRAAELDRWRAGGQFLIATQSAGGVSIDLTYSRLAIFYANGFKYAERVQAEDRQHRIGQHRPVTYVDVQSTAPIEGRIMRALSRKGDAVAEFRAEVEKVRKTSKDRLRDLVASL